MIVTFAGYDIKVGTPVVSRDGAEVGTVDSTIGEDLVVNVTTAGTQLLLTESGVAGFEPDFIRLEKTAADISAGHYDKVGETESAPEPALDHEPAAADVPSAEAAAPVGLLSTPTDVPDADAPSATEEPEQEPAAPQTAEPVAEDAPAETTAPAALTGTRPPVVRPSIFTQRT